MLITIVVKILKILPTSEPKKALRYYLLKVVNISMLVFPALVLHIPTFIGGACGRVRGGQVFTHSTIYTGDRIILENHHFMKKE